MDQMLFKTLIAVVLCSTVLCDNHTDARVNTGPEFSDRTSVKCYVCKGEPNDPCYDPIDVSGMEPEDCPSGICLKYTQSVENDLKQINRGCADNVEPVLLRKDKTEGCVLSTGTKLIQLQICNCMGHACNSVAEMKSTTFMILAASTLSFLFAKMMQ